MRIVLHKTFFTSSTTGRHSGTSSPTCVTMCLCISIIIGSPLTSFLMFRVQHSDSCSTEHTSSPSTLQSFTSGLLVSNSFKTTLS